MNSPKKYIGGFGKAKHRQGTASTRPIIDKAHHRQGAVSIRHNGWTSLIVSGTNTESPLATDTEERGLQDRQKAAAFKKHGTNEVQLRG